MRRRTAGAPVRLDARPAAAALVDPVDVGVSGLPPGRPGHRAGPDARPARAAVVVGGGVPGQRRRHAEPGHRGAGLGQLPHRRCRRAVLVAAPGARRQSGHQLQLIGGGLHRPAGSADRRARPGVGDAAAPAAGHGQRSGRAPGRLRRPVVRLGRGQARRSAVVVLGGAAGGYDDLRPGPGDERLPGPGAGLLRRTRAAAVPVLDPAGVLRPRRRLAARPPAGRGGPVVLYGASPAPRRSCCSPPTCRTWPTASWPARPPRPSTPRTARHPARPGRSAASRWRPWGTSRSPASGSRC